LPSKVNNKEVNSIKNNQPVLVKKDGTASIKRRMIMIFLTFGLSFGILGYRGVRLHTQPDNKLQNLAERQYKETVRPVPVRGNIYDRRGHELAVSVSSYSLAAHPQLIGNTAQLSKQLAAILGMKTKELRKKLSSHRKFVWIKRRLMPDEVEKIERLSDPALNLQKEARRYYPNRELASQILGAVGYDGEGLGGLELSYDEYLRGPTNRKEIAYRDARGAIFDSSDDPLEAESVSHVHLTIDRNIQYVTETELATAAHRLKIKKGTVIVLEPQSGAILAIASYPRFNPNTYQNYDLEKWRNVALSNAFEPGSVFKAITAAAALESGKFDVNSSLYCENGRLQIGNAVIKDHEKYGDLSFGEIIKYSSNIGAAKLAESVGKKDFHKMIRRFGFADKTGIDFPGEATGSIRDIDEWYPVDLAAISFGQALNATAIQIAGAYATIANNGKRMKPFLVSRVSRPSGELVKEFEPKSLGAVIRPETARTLAQLLEAVTQEGGTGTAAAIPGYRVAGKTGTAQKFDNKKKAYSKTDYFSSFVGFAPVENPRLVVYVGLDSPQGNQIYGGQVAAPIFRNVMSAALYQLKLPPTQRTLPLAEEETFNKGERKLLTEIIDSNTEQTQRVSAKSRTIPDFSGLSIRQAMALVEGRGFTIDIEGSGIAFQQEPHPGRILKDGEVCRVHFRQPS
jgi:cell division protein FtsI (penicillin-binding protein 3)